LFHWDITFHNGLRSIDLDVRRLQAAYIDTLLVSPISGIVTGVYRNTGDFVRAGQPVVRVENDEEVLLVGTLKFGGLLTPLVSNVALTTNVFSGQALSTTGSVVAVRGHDAEDEQWNVIIRCDNRVANQPPFPINYNLDFDNTTVNIT